MKNKERTEKLLKILEENNIENLLMDMLLLQNIQMQVEEIYDKKLKIKLEEFLDNLLKEYSERDLDEEAKVEFYCSSCERFLPIDKKAEGHFTDMCIDCDKEEKEYEDEEDF